LIISVVSIFFAIAAGITLRSHRPSPYAQLFAAVATLATRPIEARLTAMPYVALSKTRGRETSISPSLLRLHGIAGKILTETNTDADDEQLRGAASLLSGNNADAVRKLESAARSAPATASIWADLAAARYEQGRVGDSPELLAGAVAAADRAIEIDRHSVVALFNRALALDALHIEYGASRAYADYLSVDPAGPWATEARERRESLRRETEDAAWKRMMPSLDRACMSGDASTVHTIIQRYPEHSRRWAEGAFLSDWGETTLANNTKAALHALDFARCIGKTLPAVNGDSLLRDVVASIDLADDSTRYSLARGHVAYRTARIRFSTRDVAGAIPYFDEAIREFRKCRTPMLRVAISYRASCAFDQKEPGVAQNLLCEAGQALPTTYHALEAETLWTHSLLMANDGHPYEALDTARKSVEIFEQLHEHGNAIRMRITIANLLAVLGRSNEAWRMRRDIFAIASATGVALSMQLAITTAAENELANHRWDTAAALFTEAAKPPMGSPKLQAEALMWQAYATSRETSAQPDMRFARAAANSVPDERLREETIDEIRFADASLSRNHDAQRAIQLLSDTIAYRAKRGLRFRLADAYVERAKAFRALRSDEDARTDLEAAISLIENERSNIEDEAIRDSFVGATDSPYDELIEMAAADKDYAAVFALAERSRAGFIRRKLADVTVPSTAEVAKLLPKGLAMVQLTTTPSKMVLVVIHDGFVGGAVTSTSRGELSTLRESLVDAITHNDHRNMRVAAHRLFATLLQPVATTALSVEHLVIVPDGFTSDIPFSALVDPTTERYLIEDRTVIVTPSASAFVARRDKPNGPTRESYLLAGDPALDSQRFPTLHRLSGASEEISQLAITYGCQPLIGTALTRRHLMERIGDADLIQIAAHAVVNQRDADLSVIPLTPDANDTGLLYLGDVVRMRLPRRPVVILTGCQTATVSSGTGTVRSFAFAFLAVGSSAVVGAVGDIDDNTAYFMSLAFHRELRQAGEPAEALRRVQVALLNTKSSQQLTALSLMFQTYR
jgi:CHAT domain-containing protein